MKNRVKKRVSRYYTRSVKYTGIITQCLALFVCMHISTHTIVLHSVTHTSSETSVFTRWSWCSKMESQLGSFCRKLVGKIYWQNPTVFLSCVAVVCQYKSQINSIQRPYIKLCSCMHRLHTLKIQFAKKISPRKRSLSVSSFLLMMCWDTTPWGVHGRWATKTNRLLVWHSSTSSSITWRYYTACTLVKSSMVHTSLLGWTSMETNTHSTFSFTSRRTRSKARGFGWKE